MAYEVPLTRREAVLRQLRSEIVSGELPPGTVIKDAEVASRLGVSITPVREAITQLGVEGLIDIAPNRPRRVTRVTQKNALELIDVMMVLACAGFEWGVPNLDADHLARMKARFSDFERALEQKDVLAASSSGADVSTIVITASGNRELQTHVDLVVTRTLRLLAMTQGHKIWKIWREGYRDLIAHLERGDPAAALERHREIYRSYRAAVEELLFEDDGGP